MIEIKIGKKKLENVIDEINKSLEDKDDRIKNLVKNNDIMGQKLHEANGNIIKLQNQIIQMNSEDIKERRSLWEFLTGKDRNVSKDKRINKSIVVLDK